MNNILNKIMGKDSLTDGIDKYKKEFYDFESQMYKRRLWSPELVSWIANANAEKLSIASCLLNTWEWPEWLPGRPDSLKDIRQDTRNDKVLSHFYSFVRETCERQAEHLHPGLHQIIWMTQHFSKQ